MTLTDIQIRKAIKAGQAKKLFDGGGLFLHINPPRQPGWRLKYYFGGRENSISLGLYSDVPLKRARGKRDEARRQLDDGIDPSAARQAARAETEHTLKGIAAEWLAQQKLEPKTSARTFGRLMKWVYPRLGSRPIASITAADLLGVLRAIEQKGSHDTAHRTRSELSRIMRYAVAIGKAERDITADLKGALAPLKVQHFAALINPLEVGALLRAIEGYAGQPVTELALKILPYVFLRPGELRAGRWSEIDFDAAEWRVAPERMKMRRPHIVPLSRQVLILLRDLEALTGGGELMFPTLHNAARPLSDNTLNSALRRLGYSGDQHTAHGFRSTASSMLNEMGIHPDLIELQLAHKDSNEVRGIYNRAERLAERRKMMQQWADHLDALRAGGNVVVLNRKGAR